MYTVTLEATREARAKVCIYVHCNIIYIRLPIQLQRAMAAETEATREARAKVYRLCHTGHIFFQVFSYSIVSRKADMW